MQKIINLRNKKEKLVAGLMAGTSVDGIDCALVKIIGDGIDTEVELIRYDSYDFSVDLKEEILQASSIENSSSNLICQLNFKLGKKFAQAVKKTCKKADISLQSLDLIGSHGQTIHHIPQDSTLQIGEGSVIAHETQTPTIDNFRVSDIAAGGHGAPLVPYCDYLLYRDMEYSIGLQNIGGISNLTAIPENAGLEDVIAFDTGPGNMIIDQIVTKMTNEKLKYDKNGEIAAEGSINNKMLNELMGHSFINQPPPKTTGREEFGREFSIKIYNKYRKKGVELKDIVATVTYFTVKSIVYNYRKWVRPYVNLDVLVVSGGGAYNLTLMKMLKAELKDIEIKTQEEFGFSSEAKEALDFAILANETVMGNKNNLPQVTGANKAVILGNIILA